MLRSFLSITIFVICGTKTRTDPTAKTLCHTLPLTNPTSLFACDTLAILQHLRTSVKMCNYNLATQAQEGFKSVRNNVEIAWRTAFFQAALEDNSSILFRIRKICTKKKKK